MGAIKDFDYASCLSDIIVMADQCKRHGDVELLVSASRGGQRNESATRAIKSRIALAGTQLFYLDLRLASANDGKPEIKALLSVPALASLHTLSFRLPSQQETLFSVLESFKFSLLNTDLVPAQDATVNVIIKRISALAKRLQRPYNHGQPVMLHTAIQNGASTFRRTETAQYAKVDQKRRHLAAQLDQQGYPGPTPENPLVSICLPVQNAEKSIARTLEGLLCQTFENFEVLIADDHSDDNTLEIVSHYASRDARIILWINDEPVGAIGNFNECLVRARGKYIKPLSQDAWLHPQYLEATLEVLESSSETTLIVAAAHEGLPSWYSRGRNPSQTVLKNIVKHGLDDLRRLVPCPSSMMFRADHIGKGFNSSLPNLATVDYSLRLLTKGDLFLLPSKLVETSALSDTRKQWAGHYMELAAESIKIASNSQEVLSHISPSSASREVFIDSTLLKLGTDLTSTELKRGRIGLAAPAGAANINQDVMPIAVSLLRTLGRCQQKGGSKEAKAQEIELLEEKVRALLNSRSWRVTKALRDWNANLQLDVTTPGSLNLAEIDWTQNLAQQTYAELLRKIIREIKTSRSWRLTAPLRRWKAEQYRRADKPSEKTGEKLEI